MQESVAKVIVNYIKEQTPEFPKITDSFYEPDQGWTDTFARRLAKVGYNEKEENWMGIMWNIGKPEPLSFQARQFKVKQVQWVNKHGDLVEESEARDPDTLIINPGYSAVSVDYRYAIVQSTLNLDFLFNSVDVGSLFQELFTIRVYRSRSIYGNLPVMGNTCIYVDEIAMGEIDKFDRTQQGTLLSIPVDMVLTYPLCVPVLDKNSKPFVTHRKPLITNIQFDHQFEENLDLDKNKEN